MRRSRPKPGSRIGTARVEPTATSTELATIPAMRFGFLALLLSLSHPASGQKPITAADVTEPGRKLDRALNVVLGATGTKAEVRTICLLIVMQIVQLDRQGMTIYRPVQSLQ